MSEKNVLEEALELVNGDRAEAYGDILVNARRFADIASAATGLDIEPQHFPVLMIAVKLSRMAHLPHRDNLVDIAGYTLLAEQIYVRAQEELDTLRFP